MSEENQDKPPLNSAVKTAGNVGNFLFSNIVLPLATGGTSKAAQLLNKIGPKAIKGLNTLGSLKPQGEKKEDKTWLWVLIFSFAFVLFIPMAIILTIEAAFLSFTAKLGL